VTEGEDLATAGLEAGQTVALIEPGATTDGLTTAPKEQRPGGGSSRSERTTVVRMRR